MSGDVLRLRTATSYGENGLDSLTVKADKGRAIVAVIVGTEDLKNPENEFDFDAAMADIGYQPIPAEAEVERLMAIKAAAQRYVESVNGNPEKDIWDTESGAYEDGAERTTSDWAWKAYDDQKQKAFDEMRAALSTGSKD